MPSPASADSSAPPLARGLGRRLRWVLLAPLVVLAVLSLAYQAWSADRVQQQRLNEQARGISLHLSEFLAERRDLLSQAALTVEAAGCASADCRNRLLETLRSSKRGLRTALITDRHATVIGAAVDGDAAANLRFSQAGMRVDDRSYFQQPRATGHAYVSDGFKGRGFGEDIVVAVSAPLHDGGGGFDGVVQATLNLKTLGEILRQLADYGPDGSDLLLLDQQGHLVWSRAAQERPLLAPAPEALRNALVAGKRSGRFVDDDGISKSFVLQAVPGFGWHVAVLSPTAGLWATLWPLLLLWLVGMIVATIFIRRSLQRELPAVVAPLATLTAQLESLESGAALPADPQPGAWHELLALRQAIARQITRMSDALTSAQETAAAQSSTNQSLADAVAERERNIETQTLKLRLALAAAEDANQTKSRLLTNTSHEIRTPLYGIMGTAELLLDTPLNDGQKRSVELLLNCAQGLLGLVNDILDLSRINSVAEASASQALDLRREVQTICDALMPLAMQHGLELRYRFAPELEPMRMGDQKRLRQLLMSLIGNGLKFTESGEVAVDVVPGESDRVILTVADTGIGIPSEHIERIFEPFYQVESGMSRRFGGTGLGLAIARELIETMGGTIRVESEPQRGSRFIVDLPLPAAPPSQAVSTAGAAPALLPASTAQLHVLIVDDMEITRELLGSQVALLGAQTHGVAGGEEALEYLKRQPCHLVLMDCQMPGMDGYETSRQIRQRWPHRQLRIVAVTAHAQPGEREKCLAAGMDDYLSKPIRLQELRRVLATPELHAAL